MNATDLASIDYELVNSNRCGRLKRPVEVQTDLTGYNILLTTLTAKASLSLDGVLRIYEGTIWDFGTMAIDTPAMVRASLVHDMFCLMTGNGMLPWSARAYGDKLFREILAQYSPKRHVLNPLTHWHWVRWAGVSINSQTLARYQAKPYEGDK